MLVARPGMVRAIRAGLRRAPVVALLGPRQIGKSTLAATVSAQWPGPSTRFDLERPSDTARLADAELALAPLRGLVVLDEVQRRPDLFAVLRVLADRPRRPARFLVLGSASPALLRQGAETLAGRITFLQVEGFSGAEVGSTRLDRLWLRGGFPLSYTARSEADSFSWRSDFVRTFLERDLPQLGIAVPAATMGRYWAMLAHVHGGVLNWSELGRAMGVSDATARRYADQLEATLVLRQLPPWHENISKRQVKAPKVYLRDSGLLHALLDVRTSEQLSRSPRAGASWEGLLLQQVIQHLDLGPRQAYFWATHQGAELDLFVPGGRARRGFEFKRTTQPAVTPSMRLALADLALDELVVVHAGDHSFPLAPRIRAVAATHLFDEIRP